MSTPEDIEDLDPGRARERTELAWTRTAISFAAIGALMLKQLPMAGLPILLIGALVYFLGRMIRPHVRTRGHEHGRGLLLITAGVTLVAFAALATVAATATGAPSPLSPGPGATAHR